MVSGSTARPVVALSQTAKRALAARLARRKPSQEGRVVRQGDDLLELGEVGHPAVADRVGDQAGQVGVGQEEPAPGRHAVGLVVEPLGEDLGEVGDDGRPQQPRVDLGHAVGAVRADDRQVGHADPLFGPLGDQADTRDAAGIVGVAGANVVQEAAVDLVDDLEETGHDHLEEADRPGFERLGHQRVVGVGQGAPGQVPRFVPAETGFVEQDPHQLGDGHRGVRVVELDGDLVGEGFPVVAAAAEPRHDVGQRTGHQKVLLDEPQVAAAGGGVVGVEDARQHFGGDFFVDGVEEIAAAELQEIEVLVGGGAPEPQRVDGLSAVADDRSIIGNAAQDGRHVRHHGQPPLPHLESAVEPDLDRLGRAGRPPTGRDGSASCPDVRPAGRP